MDDLLLYPPWLQAIENFRSAGFTYGSLVSHCWLYRNFGLQVPRPDTPYEEANELRLNFLKQFAPFRNAVLTEFCMDLQSVPGQPWDANAGYEIVNPTDQTKIACQDGLREIGKALRKMRLRLAHVNRGLLTDDERRSNADAQAKAAALEQSIRRKIRRPLRLEQREEGTESQG